MWLFVGTQSTWPFPMSYVPNFLIPYYLIFFSVCSPDLPLLPVPINSVSHLSIPFYSLSSPPPRCPSPHPPPDPSALLSHLSASHPTAPTLHVSHFSVSLPFPLGPSFCVSAILPLSTAGHFCFSFHPLFKLVLTENEFLSWDVFLSDCPILNDTSLI